MKVGTILSSIAHWNRLQRKIKFKIYFTNLCVCIYIYIYKHINNDTYAVAKINYIDNLL